MKRRDFIRLAGAGAFAASFPAQAQRQTSAVIGVLTTINPDAEQLDSVRKGLGERGYVEGKNLTMVYRSAGGRFDHLPALAAELVESKVSVILAYGSPVPARSAKAVTFTIPIVFAYHDRERLVHPLTAGLTGYGIAWSGDAKVGGVHGAGGAVHADDHVVRQPVPVQIGAAVRFQIGRSARVTANRIEFEIIIGAGRHRRVLRRATAHSPSS